MRLRPVPGARAGAALGERLLLDVGPDGGDFDVVEVPQVVSQVELCESQGHLEAGFVGREVLFSEHRDDMVWPGEFTGGELLRKGGFHGIAEGGAQENLLLAQLKGGQLARGRFHCLGHGCSVNWVCVEMMLYRHVNIESVCRSDFDIQSFAHVGSGLADTVSRYGKLCFNTVLPSSSHVLYVAVYCHLKQCKAHA